MGSVPLTGSEVNLFLARVAKGRPPLNGQRFLVHLQKLFNLPETMYYIFISQVLVLVQVII